MIIDGQPDFRRLLRYHLTARWPDARISEYDPRASGQLPAEFSGAGSDLVLVGDDHGSRDGEAALRQYLKTPGFPPLVFFADEAAAPAPGVACTRLPRDKVRHHSLIASIEAILAGRDARPAPRAAPASAGLESVKGYRLLRQLSQGEYATLYLAVAAKDGAEVALKVLRQIPDAPEGGGVLDRFLQEYEIVAELRHPNIVGIRDLGISDDQAYIAMEYLPGGDLKQRLAAGMTESAALGFCRQIAGALDNLHAVGILHRDLKPGNVMLRADGSIALIDFGLAKRMQQGLQTMAGSEIFGTPHYMSPEQGRGHAVDERSDLYSLGIILHEMLTGVRPFRGRDPMQVIFHHAEAPLPILPQALSRYQQVLDKLLAKKPDDRFQSAAELLKWL